MTSTELSMGLPDERPSSRVLKPPGGGHTNIFGEPEMKTNRPRPRYDQQNSSNLNGVMNTADPNISIQKSREEISKSESDGKSSSQINSADSNNGGPKESVNPASRPRVPPGGFSSGGFW